VVFRRESKVDAFQRQISALRQQLGPDDLEAEIEESPRPYGSEPRQPEVEGASFGESPYDSRDVSGFSFSSPVPTYEPEQYEESPLPPAIPTVDAQTSVVAHDTTWKGDVQSNGSLHVHGVVEGSLTAQDAVYIAEEADVSATITAANVIVAGSVQGTIRCGSRFEVLPRGRVSADVRAPSLVVHEGATINGQVRMGPAEPDALPEQPSPAVVHRRSVRNRA
jgi:cytoskeletal protein CcmA (bactofilin family)